MREICIAAPSMVLKCSSSIQDINVTTTFTYAIYEVNLKMGKQNVNAKLQFV